MIIPDHAMPIPRLQNNTGRCAKRFAIAATILAVAGFAAADGMMAPRVMEVEVKGNPTVVRSPKQGAILATDGQRVQVVLRTHFNRGPSELAWVVPVPSEPTAVQACDDRVFTELDRLTAPRFYREVPVGGPHFSVPFSSAEAAPMSVHEVAAPAVRVESEGTAGMYDYTVLSSDSAGELEKWLHANKYAVPKGAAGVFKKYTERKWHWLAMRVRAEATTEQVLAPHPITYTYRGELVFPMMISTLSAADETEVVLYVVGRTGFETATWKDDAMFFDLRAATDSPSGTTYEQNMREATRDSGGHMFVAEFCNRWQLFGRPGMGRRFDDVLSREMVPALGPDQAITRLRACLTFSG